MTRNWTWCYGDGPNSPYPADPLWRYYFTWNCGPSSVYGASQCPGGGDYNWFLWQPNLPYTTTYRVCTHLPPNHAYTHAARYRVHHAGGDYVRVFDQQPYAGWLDLGVFQFNAGTGGYLYLGDNTGEGQATVQVGGGATQFVLHGGACGATTYPQSQLVPAIPPDRDLDEWPDSSDNCPSNYNPGQENNDGDSLGDVCDPDDDNDGMPDDYETGRACLNKWVNDAAADPDADGLSNILERSPHATDPCNPDTDADLLKDGTEVSTTATLPLNPDTDGDSCADGEEHPIVGFLPVFGGDRDPLNPDDFFDVSGDKFIDLTDALAILGHFGHGPSDDALDDLFDRDITDPSKPWRTIRSNTGVDLTDVLNNLQSFGHSCEGPP